MTVAAMGGPAVEASAAVRGIVGIGAQTFGGPKTFAAVLASAVAAGQNAVTFVAGAKLNFAPGDASSYLYRSAADTIRTEGTLHANTTLSSGGTLVVGSGILMNGFSGAANFGGGIAASGAITQSSLSLNGTLNSVQIAASGKPLFLYAPGTSAISETVRAVSNRGDAGLKCVVVGTEAAAPNAGCVLFQVAKGITSAADDAGNGTAMFRVFADGRLGLSGAAAAGGPVGAVVKKLQVYDVAGNSLGFMPIYDAIP